MKEGLRRVSAVERVCAAIRDEIVAGGLKPSDQIASVRALAGAYGVCQPTVLRALRALSSEGLIVTEPGRGAFVAPDTKRPVRHHALGIVGLSPERRKSYLVDPLNLGHVGEGVHGFANECARQGLDFMLVLSPDQAIYPPAERIIRAPVDGVYILHVPSAELLLKLTTSGKTFLVGTQRVEVYGVPWIDYDHRSGAEAAARHLVSLGHKRIELLLADLGGNDINGVVFSGLRAIAPQSRLTVLPRLPDGSNMPAGEIRRQTGEQLAARLSAPSRPTAFICMQTTIAEAVLGMLAERGLRTPEDVSIVTSGSPEHGGGPGFLTHIEIPAEELGERAARWLAERSRGKDVPVCAGLIRRKLCVRKSTGPAPGGGAG